jgi:hypothetical protein
MTVKKRNFTAELKKAQEQGAKIVCSMAPYEGYEMVYEPRKTGDPSPWKLKAGSDFRYSGRECHADWPEGTGPKPDLTDTQQLVLDALRRNNDGVWRPGYGWVWENRSTTLKHLNALVKKGFAEQTGFEQFREEYRITEDGIKVAPTAPAWVRTLTGAQR